jgi:cytochrome c
VKFLASASVLSLCLGAGASCATSTEKDAIAMVEKGAQFMKENGKEAMIRKINAGDPQFNRGALYMESKTTYVLRAGDVALEAGIYQP